MTPQRTPQSVLPQVLRSIATPPPRPEPALPADPLPPPRSETRLEPARAPASARNDDDDWIIERPQGVAPAPHRTEGDPARREIPRYETQPVPLRADAGRTAGWLPRPELFKLRARALTTTKPPSFVQRTRLRRRIRFLRQLREVQLRDLGGFALELYRFSREKPGLTRSKLAAAAETDRELRQLEYALSGRVELRVVREAGIGGACPRCGAVFGTEDRFCSNCGEALPGTTLRRDDRSPRPDPPAR